MVLVPFSYLVPFSLEKQSKIVNFWEKWNFHFWLFGHFPWVSWITVFTEFEKLYAFWKLLFKIFQMALVPFSFLFSFSLEKQSKIVYFWIKWNFRFWFFGHSPGVSWIIVFTKFEKVYAFLKQLFKIFKLALVPFSYLFAFSIEEHLKMICFWKKNAIFLLIFWLFCKSIVILSMHQI